MKLNFKQVPQYTIPYDLNTQYDLYLEYLYTQYGLYLERFFFLVVQGELLLLF